MPLINGFSGLPANMQQMVTSGLLRIPVILPSSNAPGETGFSDAASSGSGKRRTTNQMLRSSILQNAANGAFDSSKPIEVPMTKPLDLLE